MLSQTEPAYEIHTNRELEFMLTRGKPLAHFCDAYPPLPLEDVIPRKAFAPYVLSGNFERLIFVAPLIEPAPVGAPHIKGTIHFLYSIPSESWRIDAYIAMLSEAARAGWSEHFERLQGTLLGYLDWQNDAHIASVLKNPVVRHWPWVRRLRQQMKVDLAQSLRTPPQSGHSRLAASGRFC